MRIQENKLNNLSVLYICSKFVYSLFAVCFCNTFPVCVHCPCYVPVLDWIIFFLLCLLNKKKELKITQIVRLIENYMQDFTELAHLTDMQEVCLPIFSEWAI